MAQTFLEHCNQVPLTTNFVCPSVMHFLCPIVSRACFMIFFFYFSDHFEIGIFDIFCTTNALKTNVLCIKIIRLTQCYCSIMNKLNDSWLSFVSCNPISPASEGAWMWTAIVTLVTYFWIFIFHNPLRWLCPYIPWSIKIVVVGKGHHFVLLI